MGLGNIHELSDCEAYATLFHAAAGAESRFLLSLNEHDEGLRAKYFVKLLGHFLGGDVGPVLQPADLLSGDPEWSFTFIAYLFLHHPRLVETVPPPRPKHHHSAPEGEGEGEGSTHPHEAGEQW